MATLAQRGAATEGTRFYTIMAFVMALVIVAGFSLNLAMGRSSFALPAAFHVHGMIFMGWLGLYLAQAVTIASGNRGLHRQLGKLAYVFIPAMVAAGAMIIVVSIRETGGPFFFAQNEFFISNLAGLLVFGGLALGALRVRRYTGWHRRLMLVAMSALTGPGLGRLLPMPLLIPYAWPIAVSASFVFGAVAMLVDWRTNGRVHPAYWWGMGINVGGFLASMALAYSPIGHAITEAVIAGTPGAERPMGPFLPPGFTM
ncbi:hypothetical protein FHS52_001258 [Erythromicrobium ramosum]|uniref:DUF2306 domain-containing protein n=2 Tax=Erythrobacter ramosus TaxID=35811 RepID=A0ABR6HXS9_9SPHN|nr:hypothetical protein [Erythrobacter ramosus]MBB3775315.1 hypothetical protein [Erythrobacter ramosus]